MSTPCLISSSPVFFTACGSPSSAAGTSRRTRSRSRGFESSQFKSGGGPSPSVEKSAAPCSTAPAPTRRRRAASSRVASSRLRRDFLLPRRRWGVAHTHGCRATRGGCGRVRRPPPPTNEKRRTVLFARSRRSRERIGVARQEWPSSQRQQPRRAARLERGAYIRKNAGVAHHPHKEWRRASHPLLQQPPRRRLRALARARARGRTRRKTMAVCAASSHHQEWAACTTASDARRDLSPMTRERSRTDETEDDGSVCHIRSGRLAPLRVTRAAIDLRWRARARRWTRRRARTRAAASSCDRYS